MFQSKCYWKSDKDCNWDWIFGQEWCICHVICYPKHQTHIAHINIKYINIELTWNVLKLGQQCSHYKRFWFEATTKRQHNEKLWTIWFLTRNKWFKTFNSRRESLSFIHWEKRKVVECIHIEKCDIDILLCSLFPFFCFLCFCSPEYINVNGEISLSLAACVRVQARVLTTKYQTENLEHFEKYELTWCDRVLLYKRGEIGALRAPSILLRLSYAPVITACSIRFDFYLKLLNPIWISIDIWMHEK